MTRIPRQFDSNGFCEPEIYFEGCEVTNSFWREKWRILRAVIFTVAIFLAPIVRAQTVAVTGNLTDLGGANATAPTTYVQFTLQNYGASIPTVAGSRTIVNPTPPVLQPNSSGVISGTITPNDLIQPAGTYYQVCVFFQGGSQWCNNFLITQATNPWNLNTATPIITPPLPSGYIAYPRTFVFLQSPAATTWTINHGFGSQSVVVDCYNTVGQLIIPDTVTETSSNTVTVTFVTAQAGSCVVMNAGNVSLTNQPANAVVQNPNGSQNIVGFPLSVSTLASNSGTPATAGFLRLASANTIDWASNAQIGQNIALSKDSFDYMHINGAAWQQDCPAPGVASCPGGLTIFSNNENPGVSSHGWDLVFQQNNSLGATKSAVVQNCGFADATSGIEQGVCDFEFYINGTQQVLAIGGTLGGGNVPILSPTTDNLWMLGQSSTRFKSSNVVQENLSVSSYTEGGPPAGNSTFDVCQGSSAVHQLACNNNNQGYFALVQTGNTSGTHSDSGFLQSASAGGCTTAGSIGGTCGTATTITWPTPFADTSYIVSCQGVGAITNFPIIGSATISSASAISVQTMALTAAAASFATIHCIGVHN